MFDLRGYLVVRNALTSEQVEDLNSRLEERLGVVDYFRWKDPKQRKGAPMDPVHQNRRVVSKQADTSAPVLH